MNGKLHGYGVRNWANNSKYEGQWQNGSIEGYGKYWNENDANKDEATFEGTFENSL